MRFVFGEQISLFDVNAKREAPKMPEEYIGKMQKGGGYTATDPREWTENEIKWILSLKAQGYSVDDIAKSAGRSSTSVSLKLKRITKKANDYNQDHYEDKYEANRMFLDEIQPKNVLDLYCGERNFYASYNTVTNDKNPDISADYHMDSLQCICMLYAQWMRFDLIDLDPFGSAYDCIDLAVKMARKGLCITLGELGHKRWHRLDYVSTHYGIESDEDFTINNIIQHIQAIGIRNKKRLVVFAKREWRNIGRVYFKIEPIKVTSQWEKQTHE